MEYWYQGARLASDRRQHTGVARVFAPDSLCAWPSAYHFINIVLPSLQIKNCFGASVFSIVINILPLPKSTAFNYLTIYIVFLFIPFSVPCPFNKGFLISPWHLEHWLTHPRCSKANSLNKLVNNSPYFLELLEESTEAVKVHIESPSNYLLFLWPKPSASVSKSVGGMLVMLGFSNSRWW